jgi:mannosyltransferase
MNLKSQKATQWTLLAITWVAFLLRVVHLSRQSLWRDEVDSLLFSTWPLKDVVRGLLQAGHNGPLFFLLLRPWLSLSGSTEFALRYPSALLGTLAVPLAFVLARQLGFSRRAGVLLGLLLASSPYLVWYGQEAKMYTLLLALITLAFTAYLKALVGGDARWWLAFVAATTISFYIHILSPLMLLVYGLVALLHWPELRRRWRGWLVSMACLTLPYLPLAFWQFPLLVQGAHSGHPFYSLRQEIYILLQLYSSGLVRFAGLAVSLFFVFLLLSGLFLAHRAEVAASWSSGPPDLARRLTLAAWLLVPPLVVYLISLRVQVFEDRYLIYIAPAFYLLVAGGLVQLRRYSTFLASLGLGLLLMVNLMGIWHQQRQPLKADFRAAAAYLVDRAKPKAPVMIQIPYLQYTFKYYYPRRKYPLLEGLWTNDGKSEATVDTEMRTLTAHLSDLWLVVSEEELWDSRHLTRAWLNEHAVLVEQASFARVDVYYYQFQPGDISTQRPASTILPLSSPNKSAAATP